MPDGNSDVVPPESIPNSEVKRVSGDGSVGSPHVRVAHRQAPNSKKPAHLSGLFSFLNHVSAYVIQDSSILNAHSLLT